MRAAILPTSEIYVTYLTHTLSRYVKLRVNREGENIGHFYVDLVHKALFGPRKTIGPRLVFPMSTPGENNLIKQWCSQVHYLLLGVLDIIDPFVCCVGGLIIIVIVSDPLPY